jgi:hypothetical protein
VTIISILFCASALLGLALGFLSFSMPAIVLASPFAAFLSAALPLCQGFGPLSGVAISIGSLAALQSLYLVGALMRHRRTPSLRAQRSNPWPGTKKEWIASSRCSSQ